MRYIKQQLILSILLAAIIMAGGATLKPGMQALDWLAPQTAWAIATEEELLEEERQAEAAERARQEEAARMEAERQAEARWAAEQWRQRLAETKPQMVYVQGGTFRMGYTFDDLPTNSYDLIGMEDAKPVHQVTLRSFYIGKYEVTFAEYDAFCEATGRNQPDDSGWGRGQRPAGNISWFDAVAFCNWRSRQDGLRPAYSISGEQVSCDFTADGYRLPTEAEWEYAAKGGNRGKGYKYSGSNDIYSVAWTIDNSNYMTHPVGEKQPNELGLYDMSGNVEEWCWDWYDKRYYQFSISDNPVGPNNTIEQSRSRRGGSYSYKIIVSDRIGYRPNKGFKDFGFRLVRAG